MPRDPTVELWTLYALGVSFTVLRTYARVVAVGFRELRADDYLIWVAILFYSAQCSLGYNVGMLAHGLDNSGMTDEYRSALSPDDPEYGMRIIGSKIQVAGWSTAICLLWTLKLCMTFFYFRLTNGLERYNIRIYIAMGLIVTTFIGNILTILLSCRPFNHYWQINPNPGNVCQAGVSKPIVWLSFVTNVLTDVFLFCIPIPMLWKSTLRFLKKIAATLVLSAGIFIIVCATLKSIYVIVDPAHGGQLAAAWGTRETFIAVATTNLPMIFPLLKTWIAPFLPSSLRSSSANKAYKSPGSGFVTIGGGGGASNRSKGRDTTNMTLDNDSEERIVKGHGDIKMSRMPSVNDNAHRSSKQITVSKQISVTTEDFHSQKSAQTFSQV